ncbi:hypothetical protein BMS3Abin03_02850 [bacterium BMS3Abin03]|nr:hypothetical protein BMS3Abin03_02850 [bacterium BMS3Abin03]
MIKLVLTVIFVFLAIGILISAKFYSDEANKPLTEMQVKFVEEPEIASIKAIQLMTATEDLNFTIKNALN